MINNQTANIMNAFKLNEIQEDSELVIFRGPVSGMGVEKSQLGLFRAIKMSTHNEMQHLKFEVNTKIDRLDIKMSQLQSDMEKIIEAVTQK